MRRSVRRGEGALVWLVGLLVLTGCGPAPWTVDDPEATPSATTTVAPPVPNDLSSGSTQRELVAGAVTAKVDYWSTLSMDRWTAGAVKPLSVSLVTNVTPDDGQKVYLQKATVTAVAAAGDRNLAPLDPQTDAATVAPGYLVLAPYSYSQTFNVGPLDAKATSVSLQVTFDFLVQTTPTSAEYAKQTATDTLTVAIAQPESDD